MHSFAGMQLGCVDGLTPTYSKGIPMRITIHYALAVVILTIYGGQV